MTKITPSMLICCGLLFSGIAKADNPAPALTAWTALRAQCVATVPGDGKATFWNAISACQQMADAAFQASVLIECMANVRARHADVRQALNLPPVPQWMKDGSKLWDAEAQCREWWGAAAVKFNTVEAQP